MMGVYERCWGTGSRTRRLNIRPDENYARELMQLFTIGLVAARRRRHAEAGCPTISRSRRTTRRSSKGSRTCSRDGTGRAPWVQPAGCGFSNTGGTGAEPDPTHAAVPRRATTPGEKRLLTYPNAVKRWRADGPSRSSGISPMHSTTSFITPTSGRSSAAELIQRLATSNPSPAYVGAGERGVRRGRRRAARQSRGGRARDPSRRGGTRACEHRGPRRPASSRSRCCGSHSSGEHTTAELRTTGTSTSILPVDFGQGPLQGALRVQLLQSLLRAARRGSGPGELVAPELQIATEYQNALVTNYFYTQIGLPQLAGQRRQNQNLVVIDIDEEVAARRTTRPRWSGADRRENCLRARSRTRCAPGGAAGRTGRPSSQGYGARRRSASGWIIDVAGIRRSPLSQSGAFILNRMTRRCFLRAVAAGGFAYAFARTPRVTYAQMTGGGSFADYKALVCVFLFGGNDSWNMVVPASAAEYAEYAGLAAESRRAAGRAAAAATGRSPTPAAGLSD